MTSFTSVLSPPSPSSSLLDGFASSVHHLLADASYYGVLAPTVLGGRRRGRLRSWSVPRRHLAIFHGFCSEFLFCHVSDCCSMVKPHPFTIFWRMHLIMVFLLLLCSAVGAEGAFGAGRYRGATWRFSLVLPLLVLSFTARPALHRCSIFFGCRPVG
jgi:hypothetical protein